MTDDQRQAVADHILGQGAQVEALLGGVGVVLASGTANDHAMDLGLDQVFQDIGERGLVDAAIGRHPFQPQRSIIQPAATCSRKPSTMF